MERFGSRQAPLKIKLTNFKTNLKMLPGSSTEEQRVRKYEGEIKRHGREVRIPRSGDFLSPSFGN